MNYNLLLNPLGSQYMEKAEILNVIFASASACKIELQISQASDTWGKVWSKDDVCLVEEDLVWEY